MNKEIIKIDEKIIVEDENGIKKEVVCSNNLEKILTEENNLELIEKKNDDINIEINSLKKQINYEKKSNDKSFKQLLVVDIMIPFLTYISVKYFGFPTTSLNAISCAILTFASVIGVSIMINSMSKSEIKQLTKKLSADEIFKTSLDKEISNKKSLIEKLKKENNYIVKNEEISTIEIPQNDKLENKFKFYNYIISNYGYLKEKYQKGELKNILSNYDDELINSAFEYFNTDSDVEINKKYVKTK